MTLVAITLYSWKFLRNINFFDDHYFESYLHEYNFMKYTCNPFHPIFVTGPAKTGHICTNYTCSENGTFLDLCLRYSCSVHYTVFLLICE